MDPIELSSHPAGELAAEELLFLLIEGLKHSTGMEIPHALWTSLHVEAGQAVLEDRLMFTK